MSRDLRRYASQTNFRLVIGFIVLLFVIGVGLIWVFYGQAAALMGLICLLGVSVPLVLILAALWGIDWVAKHSNLH